MGFGTATPTKTVPSVGGFALSTLLRGALGAIGMSFTVTSPAGLPHDTEMEAVRLFYQVNREEINLGNPNPLVTTSTDVLVEEMMRFAYEPPEVTTQEDRGDSCDWYICFSDEEVSYIINQGGVNILPGGGITNIPGTFKHRLPVFDTPESAYQTRALFKDFNYGIILKLSEAAKKRVVPNPVAQGVGFLERITIAHPNPLLPIERRIIWGGSDVAPDYQQRLLNFHRGNF